MRLICAIRTQASALSMDCSQSFSGPPQPCEGVLHNLSSRQNLEALAVSDRFTILMVQRPMPISASRGFGPGHHDLRSLSQTNRIITRRNHLTHFRSGSQSSKISDGLAMVWRCVAVTGCRGRHGSWLWRHQWGVRSRVRAAAGASSIQRFVRRPPPRQDLEASLPFGAANDFENEIPAGGGIHQSGAIISTVGTQMLEPWPPFPDGGNDLPDFGTVGNVRAGRMIDGYVALAANDLSGRVDPALWRRRSFDRPAVDNRRCQTPLTPFALPVKHEHNSNRQTKRRNRHAGFRGGKSFGSIRHRCGQDNVARSAPRAGRWSAVCDRAVAAVGTDR